MNVFASSLALSLSIVSANKGFAVTGQNPPSFLTLLPHSSQGELDKNPGFFADTGLVIHPKLQACIDQSFAELKAAHGKSFGITLVDLTGDDKLKAPQFAEFHSKISIYAASQSKAGALVSAHQLLSDLRAVASQLPKFNLDQAFAEANKKYAVNGAVIAWNQMFQTDQGHQIVFKPEFKKALDDMVRFSNNDMASLVIKDLGFNYIDSVLWQLGLYGQNFGGGLWVARGYGKNVGTWHRDPIGNYSHSSNPLAMSKFMTLIAQGRFVSKEMSESMLNILANTSFPIKFVQGLQNMGLKVNLDGAKETDPTKKATVYRKSGSMGDPAPVSHDAIIVLRTACLDKPACTKKKDLRYVATGASAGKTTHSMALIEQKLDACIVENNL